MTSSHATPGGIRQSIRETVRFHSGLFIAQGVIMTLLGIAALVWPQISSLAVELYVGWVFLISGIVGLGLMFYAPTAGSFVWALLTSALTLFAGVILLWHPIAGTVSLTLVLTAFFLAEGLFQIMAAISHRNDFPESWGWMVLSGIADLILVALIVAGWPSSAVWVLGVFAGVNLITSGIAILVVATTVRSAAREA
ncbi:MAG: DUF308 domain-containing protein [Alphaproteobacteria bacterium]|nr:DUF308 domain-containing protein [Alphaproteobacteria bacterium]